MRGREKNLLNDYYNKEKVKRGEKEDFF